MPTPSALILDSGIGGLSITKEIRALIPGLGIHYVADTAGFPYGTKSAEEIVHRVTSLTKQLTEHIAPDIIVIACNTASTVALNSLREVIQLPVVGVVPAVKPAAQLSKSGVIGILATEGTVNRTYTHNLIKEFARDHQVMLHGSARLVELAEHKLLGLPLSLSAIHGELKPLLNQSAAMDTVVLACTHFPLLKEELLQCSPTIQFWVDSGEAIARRVKHLLESEGIDLQQVDEDAGRENFLYLTSNTRLYNKTAIETLLGKFATCVTQTS